MANAVITTEVSDGVEKCIQFNYDSWNMKNEDKSKSIPKVVKVVTFFLLARRVFFRIWQPEMCSKAQNVKEIVILLGA